MAFTISEFWTQRLSVPARGKNTTVLKGWKHIDAGLPTFVEAPLSLGTGFGDTDPWKSGVILISAPGAVGKSTLARQIANETGAMYVDLAAADPVGANTLVGGLARTNLYGPFQQGEASLIVDGLDEARMRVNQPSFVAFMLDVAGLAGTHHKPVVLLGRTGAVQEAWLWLSEQGIEAPVFEIGYYDKDQAAKFARIQAKSIRKEQEEREPDGRAIDLIIELIRSQSGESGDAFAGYSPVLIAVASWVADPDNPDTQNTQLLISSITQGKEQISLTEISNFILVREQSKLDPLEFDDETLRDQLYTPNKQLAQLVAVIYRTERPSFPSMSAKDRETYTNALENWVPEHPFLDGSGRYPSSAVFGGMIASEALSTESSSEAALSRELDLGTAINPFLSEFYMKDLPQFPVPHIPAVYIGIFYASLRARLSLGETANLRIDADDTDDPSEAVEVEITRTNTAGKELVPLRFTTEPDGHFRFGPQIENIDISAPHAHVSIGHGCDAVLISPVIIDVEEINFETDRVVVEASADQKSSGGDVESNVYLKAKKLNAPRITSRPMLYGKVELQLSLIDPTVHPWTEFVRDEDAPPDDPRMDEALRRLKRILRLFGCHGKHQLAKYRGAIDHPRRTNGLGRVVRDQLLEDDVLSVQGPMYCLDPDRLARVVGLTVHQVRGTGSTPLTQEFLKRTLNRRN